MSQCPRCGALLVSGSSTCPSCSFAVSGQPPGVPTQVPPGVTAAAAPPPPSGRGGKVALWAVVVGVGCTVMVGVVGIIAAILIPNFIDALNKAKVKRSMADMHTVTLALGEYGVEHSAFPAADSMDALALALGKENEPTFPKLDGWKRPFRYQCLEPRGSGCDSYALASAGKDGVFEQEDSRNYQENRTSRGDYDRDLVVIDSMFVQWPADR